MLYDQRGLTVVENLFLRDCILLFSGSLGGSREATPPYRQSISYNPPSVAEAINKPGVRSQSWSSEVPIMPPLSVEVEPTNMIGMSETL